LWRYLLHFESDIVEFDPIEYAKDNVSELRIDRGEVQVGGEPTEVPCPILT
jgi:hypothetical protein